MIVVKSVEQCDINSIYFCDPIKNNIVDDGKFIKILYSSSNFILNGIYLLLNFNEINVERYYNKYKCSFNINNNEKLIESIKNIENNLLSKYELIGKMPNYKIYEQLKNGNIKLFCDNLKKTNNNSFILKISGLWETDIYYGLTYKFIKVN